MRLTCLPKLTKAALSVIRQNKSRLANTLKASQCVHTVTKQTEVGLRFTFVNVCKGKWCQRGKDKGREWERAQWKTSAQCCMAGRGRLTNTVLVLQLVTRRTDTAERAVQVLTRTRGAGAGVRHALINVCKRNNTLQTAPKKRTFSSAPFQMNPTRKLLLTAPSHVHF